MDLSILLGVAGILVSVGVGFGTFYIADKRARRHRWQTAKDMILRDLSKSLGESNVPDASVIKATIRSVLRGENANDLSVVTLEEVSDDLLRQITADPFLEPDRRKQLQADVLKLKEAQTELEADMTTGQGDHEASVISTDGKFTASTFVAILSGIVASALAATSFTAVEPLLAWIKQQSFVDAVNTAGAIMSVLATVLASLVFLLSSSRRRKNRR